MYRIFHSFRLLEPPLDWNPNRKVVPGTVYFTALLINYSWCKLWRCSWNCGIINGNILLYMIYRLLNKKKTLRICINIIFTTSILFLICRNTWRSVPSAKLDLLTRLRHKEPKKENDDERLGGIPITESPLCYGKLLFLYYRL